MKISHYLHLRQTGANTNTSKLKDVELSELGWWCRSCHSPKPRNQSFDFRIAEAGPVSSPMSGAGHFGVTLARRDFLALLGETNVARDLMLGSLFGPSGAPIEGWATVYGRHRIIVRGNLKKGFEHFVGTRSCEECGNLIYFAYPPNYLYPAPNPDVAIFQSQLGGLVVRPELIAHLDLKRKKGFGIEKLKVLEKPRDGLGVLVAT